jgi:hypothetical protein
MPTVSMCRHLRAVRRLLWLQRVSSRSGGRRTLDLGRRLFASPLRHDRRRAKRGRRKPSVAGCIDQKQVSMRADGLKHDPHGAHLFVFRRGE